MAAPLPELSVRLASNLRVAFGHWLDPDAGDGQQVVESAAQDRVTVGVDDDCRLQVGTGRDHRLVRFGEGGDVLVGVGLVTEDGDDC